jgi:hypothetical protein
MVSLKCQGMPERVSVFTDNATHIKDTLGRSVRFKSTYLVRRMETRETENTFKGTESTVEFLPVLSHELGKQGTS